jgi:1,4-dihydroxy-6-naphthoate synthase
MPVPISVGHSPDADDAFMFYGIASGAVSQGPFEIQHVVEDIQTLNQRALTGDLEVTAISAAVYPQVADRYRILSCGASIGRKYGPVVLSRPGDTNENLEGRRIAIPGAQTTAYLLIRIFAKGFEPVITDFDEVLPSLDQGKVDAALVIHEGQVTWKELGYVNLMDLGQVWFNETGLPIPLGLDVVRRDLGEAGIESIFHTLRDSIVLTRDDEERALDYAMAYGRGIDRELCRTFVRMYVNDDTVQMGNEGRQALQTLYERALAAGLIDRVPPLDIVGLE